MLEIAVAFVFSVACGLAMWWHEKKQKKSVALFKEPPRKETVETEELASAPLLKKNDEILIPEKPRRLGRPRRRKAGFIRFCRRKGELWMRLLSPTGQVYHRPFSDFLGRA